MAFIRLPYVDPDLGLRTFSFSPVSGTVGTQITLSGSSLAVGVSQVFFNGVPASRFADPNNPANIIAIVPAGATSGPITISFADGGSGSGLQDFTVLQGIANPMIRSFFPAAGQPGQPVQLDGSGFLGAESVRFGGVPAQFIVQADTNIIAYVPQGAVDGFITVQRGTAIGQSSTIFDVTSSVLSITGINPNSGVAGTAVNITGTSLNGVDTVMFGNLNANFFIPNDGLITAFAPPHLPGTSVQVSVRKGTAQATSGTLRFTYTDFGGGGTGGPVVNSFSPTSGAVNAVVQINGSGFIGTEAVRFGSVNAPFTVQSDSVIFANVPFGAVDGPISVVRSGQVGQSQGIFDVTTNTGFGITSITPNSGPAGTSVTITGFGFAGVDTVLFGSTPTNFALISDTQIIASAAGIAGTSVSVILRKGSLQVSSGTLRYTFQSVGGGGTVRPTITGINPNPAFTGQEVRITGSGFTGATLVRIGLSSVRFRVVSDNDLRLTAPDFTLMGRVSVTNAAGTGISSTFLSVF